VIPISESGLHRSKEVALAAHWLRRLPLFPQASIREVLDIRRELEKPLLRFRGAMIGFSEKIQDAPWDKDFSVEAERVFVQDVTPAILNLEEEVQSNNFMTALTSELAIELCR
jgi:hypothetical protein